MHDGRRELVDLYQKQHAIQTEPDLLEFYGFVFYFPSFLVGPTFSFRDYHDFTNQQGDFKSIPPTLKPGLKTLGYAVVSALIFYFFEPYFNFGVLMDESRMQSYSLVYRWCLIYAVGTIARTRFYIVWKLSEAACILSGIGYQGKVNGQDRWDRLENVNIYRIEFSDSPKALLAEWNKNTAMWLKQQVYKRLLERGVKVGLATGLTSLTSAFWHGIHLGYYVTFFTLFLLTTTARKVEKALSLGWASPVYNVISLFATQFIVNYSICAFMVRDLKSTIGIYKQVYFLGHLVLLVTFVLFSFLFHTKKKL